MSKDNLFKSRFKEERSNPLQVTKRTTVGSEQALGGAMGKINPLKLGTHLLSTETSQHPKEKFPKVMNTLICKILETQPILSLFRTNRALPKINRGLFL